MIRVKAGILIVILLAPIVTDACETQWILPSADGSHFIESESGEKFIAVGVNYDHDDTGRLIEDYWYREWSTVEEDFQEIKELGARVVRIHLQTAQFMETMTDVNQTALLQLLGLITLAEQKGLYLNITGLGCYHKQDTPAWYDTLSESERWKVQARFWEEIAKIGAEHANIFCYDLMNEPALPNNNGMKRNWVTGEFAGKYFIQYIALDLAGRTREQVAKDWVDKLVAAIRKYDTRHMITVGENTQIRLTFPKEKSLFYSTRVGENLDFASVHIYPRKEEIDNALEVLSVYDAGKPIVIEEMYPLYCDMEEMAFFMDESRDFVDGYISFYWGQPFEQYLAEEDLASIMIGEWIRAFSMEMKK